MRWFELFYGFDLFLSSSIRLYIYILSLRWKTEYLVGNVFGRDG